MVCTHVDTAQSPTHLVNHHAHHGMTYAMDVERMDTGNPNAEVDIKDPRTKHLNTTTEEEDKRRSMELELIKTPLWWGWCCCSCSADITSQGMTSCQTQEEWSWSWNNWDIQCLDRLNNKGLCSHPDACWDWTQSTCDSQVQGLHWCRW